MLTSPIPPRLQPHPFARRRTASGQPCCRGSNTNTMLRFAANIGGGHVKRIFSEYPFRERFDRAAAAGFEAVEFPEPYGEDVHAIRPGTHWQWASAGAVQPALGRLCSWRGRHRKQPNAAGRVPPRRLPRARGRRSAGLPADTLPCWDHAAAPAARGATGSRLCVSNFGPLSYRGIVQRG